MAVLINDKGMILTYAFVLCVKINSYVKQFIQELQGHHMPLNRKTDNYQECLTKKINYIIETLKGILSAFFVSV